MKKFLLLFTLMLLVFNCTYSVSKIMPENDWKVKDLKGKVKTMVNTKYEYDEKTGKLEKTWVTTTDFNRQGYITKEVEYVNNRLNHSIVYENNKEGLPTKRIKESLIKNNPEAKKMFKSEDTIFSYKYEETKDGNLLVTIKEENIDERYYPSLEKTTYDKNGRRIHQLNYSGGELIGDHTSIYNENGILIEEKDNQFPKRFLKVAYDYKPSGYPAGYYLKTTDVPGARWIYLYDKNGNEQEYAEIHRIGSTGVDEVVMYLRYKDIARDKYGNLTSRTSILYDYSTEKKIGIHEKIENKYEYYE